jgi:hypothetical protein
MGNGHINTAFFSNIQGQRPGVTADYRTSCSLLLQEALKVVMRKDLVSEQ